MLVVMHRRATDEQLQQVLTKIRDLGLTPHPMPGPTRTAIGITGNTNEIDPRSLSGMAGVSELLRVTKPYKLASREMQPEDTVVELPQTTFGEPAAFTVVAGPCSVEQEETMLRIGDFLMQRGVKLLRAGAFKPRTSPYSFQGMEHKGLEVLSRVREKTGIGVVSEVMDAAHAQDVEQAVDMLQIGARNMQNFTLLKRLAQCKKPILLKRGMAATLDEWLMACEYLLAGGNKNVVLCERGVRTFTDHTRNTMDLSVVPPIKELSHLPIIVDPSHGTGRRAYVSSMALAGLAAGADGLMVEVHPQPEEALSDGSQTIDFAQFDAMLADLRKVADALGREIV